MDSNDNATLVGGPIWLWLFRGNLTSCVWSCWALKQWVATIWAGWVWHQPCVYAPHMEPMIAFGQHPNLLPLHKLAQANWAFSGRNLHSGPINCYRNLAQSTLLEASSSLPLGLRGEPSAAAHGAAHDWVEPKCSY